ncbi:hypothetical protein WJ972_13805 [Achromobacter insuavis]
MTQISARPTRLPRPRATPLHAALGTLTLALAVALGAAPSTVHAQAAAVKIDIPAQSLAQALLQLGRQTGCRSTTCLKPCRTAARRPSAAR